MGLYVEAEFRIGWTPAGGGGTFLGQAQANIPGQGQITQVNRAVFNAQVLQIIDGQPVPVAVGSEGSVTLANINTALTNIVSDVAGSSGTPLITAALLATIQGWASGNP